MCIEENNYGELVEEGTLLRESNEIAGIRFEIDLLKDDSSVVSKIIEKLEHLGAPKGSTLSYKEEVIHFGKKEGLALYLDGANLPDETYQTCDINFVVSEIYRLTEIEHSVDRYWEGENETALYLYGDSFDEMRRKITEFVNTYPLCKNARIVQIA